MGGRPLRNRLNDYLHERHALLILDNFEHVVAAAPDVAALLTDCPCLTMLITSRDVLRLSGEHGFPVPPLTLPDSNVLPPVADLMSSEAIRLFLARAEAVQPDFALTDANAATWWPFAPAWMVSRWLSSWPLPRVTLAALWSGWRGRSSAQSVCGC